MAVDEYAQTGNSKITKIAGSGLTSGATDMDLDDLTGLGLDGLTSPQFALVKITKIAQWRADPLQTPEVFEIVKITADNGSENVSIDRGEEGTSGTAFAVGDPVELVWTSGEFQHLVDTLTDGLKSINVGDITTTNAAVIGSTITAGSGSQVITTAAGKLDHTAGDAEFVDTVAIALASNVLVSGGGVSYTGTGLVFDVGAAVYWIDGVQYSTSATQVTLAAEHASLDRIDLIILDDTPQATSVTGTAAASPAEPSLDSTTQLKLSAITVNDSGGGGGPVITIETIYTENAGTPGEWAATASDASHDVTATGNPQAGTVHVEATSAAKDDYVQFIDAAAFNLSTFGTITIYVKSKASWSNQKRLLGEFFLAGVSVSSQVIFAKNSEPDFDSTQTSTYQQLIRDISDFGLTNTSPDEFRVTVSGGGSSIGYYMDSITMETTSSGGGFVPHAIIDHTDTVATGAELNTLTDGSDADALHTHPTVSSHTIASHSDTTATGAELETLTDASDASALHVHTVASLDTTATGAELTSLTDDSMVDALHRHSELSASDGTPNPCLSADAAGDITLTNNLIVDGTCALDSDVTVTANVKVSGATNSVIVNQDNAGIAALTRTMAGLELTAKGVGNDNYFAALKFMSTDPQFTTENPKFLGAIAGRATQAYSSDTTGGMAMEFSTTPNTPGATSLPVLALTIESDSNVTVDVGDLTVTVGDFFVSVGDLFVAAGDLYIGGSTNPGLARLHVEESSAGAFVLFASAAALLLEASGDNGLTIASGTVNQGNIHFTDADADAIGRITYDHNIDVMEFWINSAASVIIGPNKRMSLGSTATIETVVAQLEVQQHNSSAAIPVLVLNQADVDDAFVNFVGTSAADSTKSISSSTAEAAAKFGAYRVEINGTTKWVRVYDSAV